LAWLEDIVAVIDTGSFGAAAAKRFVTQPAFSRRIQAIEEYVGVELFDREHRPTKLKPSVLAQQAQIKRLVADIHDLLYELRRQSREAHKRIVIASQHAITTSRAPAIVEMLTNELDVSIRLRSANRDECFALLMTRQVDVVIHYSSTASSPGDGDDFMESCELEKEEFIPVFCTSQLSRFERLRSNGELPVIAYPSEAFFGQIFTDEILPKIPNSEFVRRKVETALTLAALQLAISGVGVAWVPVSLADAQIHDGSLSDLTSILPSTTLMVCATRLKGEHNDTAAHLWRHFTDQQRRARLL
jgi:DNA-binding transcriptional LysR family regulator